MTKKCQVNIRYDNPPYICGKSADYIVAGVPVCSIHYQGALSRVTPHKKPHKKKSVTHWYGTTHGTACGLKYPHRRNMAEIRSETTCKRCRKAFLKHK